MLYNNMELHNILAISETKKGEVCISRLTDVLRKQMVNDEIAFSCAGVEIRFKLVDPKVTLQIESFNELPTAISIFHGSYKLGKLICVNKGMNEIVIEKLPQIDRLKNMELETNMGFDSEMIRVILNNGNFGPPKILGQIESPAGLSVPPKTYLAYGSSITAGGSSVLPDLNYVSRTAWKLGAQNINLGFAGCANLEKALADYIAQQKNIDFLSMELGVNMVWDMEKNDWSGTDVFRERVEYFIPTIAEAHKDIPIVCTDIFLSGNDFFMDQLVFAFRDIVREVAIKFERKNKLFKYVCGKDLLTTYEGLTMDQLHPNNIGMIDIGDNLFEAFSKLK